jgi:hypothetical protein
MADTDERDRAAGCALVQMSTSWATSETHAPDLRDAPVRGGGRRTSSAIVAIAPDGGSTAGRALADLERINAP